MTAVEGSTCRSCRKGTLQRRQIVQTFERDGHEVRIEGVPALVCDACGESWFEPGVAEKLRVAADELLSLSAIKHDGGYKAVV